MSSKNHLKALLSLGSMSLLILVNQFACAALLQSSDVSRSTHLQPLAMGLGDLIDRLQRPKVPGGSRGDGDEDREDEERSLLRVKNRDHADHFDVEEHEQQVGQLNGAALNHRPALTPDRAQRHQQIVTRIAAAAPRVEEDGNSKAGLVSGHHDVKDWVSH